jgi:hypothetical protein
MDQYREALNQFNTSGNGVDQSEMANFHEHIKKNVCKYYFVLEPVLKDRPNMTPAWTNHSTDRKSRSHSSSGSDDESEATSYGGNNCNASDNSSFCEVVQQSGARRGTVVNSNNKRTSDNFKSVELMLENDDINRDCSYAARSNDVSVINDESNISSLSNEKIYNTNDEDSSNLKGKRSGRRGRKKHKSASSSTATSISPVRAKNIQINLYKDKQKQIFSGTNKNKRSNWNTTQSDHNDYFENCRNTKLLFEKEKYDYLKQVDKKKIEIEEKRLEIEASTSMLKQEQIRLESKRLEIDNELSISKKEQIVMQTNLEKSKLLLNNVEIYKARLAIKKEDPTVTDEFLDKHFKFM